MKLDAHDVKDIANTVRAILPARKYFADAANRTVERVLRNPRIAPEVRAITNPSEIKQSLPVAYGLTEMHTPNPLLLSTSLVCNGKDGDHKILRTDLADRLLAGTVLERTIKEDNISPITVKIRDKSFPLQEAISAIGASPQLLSNFTAIKAPQSMEPLKLKQLEQLGDSTAFALRSLNLERFELVRVKSGVKRNGDELGFDGLFDKSTNKVIPLECLKTEVSIKNGERVVSGFDMSKAAITAQGFVIEAPLQNALLPSTKQTIEALTKDRGMSL